MSERYPLRAEAEARFSGSLVFITPEAHKALGLARALRGLRVLTAGDDEACAPLRALGAEVVAVDTVDRGSTRALVESELGQATLRAWAPARAVLFRVDHATQVAIEDTGVAVLGADPRAARGLENKDRFRRLAAAAGLPVVPTVSGTWGAAGLDVEVPFGWPRVVQSPRGYAGRRTWWWREGAPEPGLAELEGRSALVAPLLAGPTWTVNACAYADAVVVGAAMRQVDGDERLATGRFSSAGASFGAPGAGSVEGPLRELAARVGRLAAEQGFRGFFGIDAVAAPGGLTLIEMNARFTATVAMATLAELAAGRTPLAVHALLAWSGVSPGELGGADLEPIAVAPSGHLIVRDTGRALREVPAGLYARGEDGALERVGAVPSGLPPSAESVVVWPAGPRAGGPEEDRQRLLFASSVMGPHSALGGGLSDIAEAALRLVFE